MTPDALLPLTKEQIEEFRTDLIDPRPWASEKTRVAAINALCDLALSALDPKPTGVPEMKPEIAALVRELDALSIVRPDDRSTTRYEPYAMVGEALLAKLRAALTQGSSDEDGHLTGGKC